MYLEMSVTSSDVDVTSAISSDVGLTTPMWKRLNVYWVFVTTVLARKFHKNFSKFPLKKCGTFFVFCAKKSLSVTETVARRVSSWELKRSLISLRVSSYSHNLAACLLYAFHRSSRAALWAGLGEPHGASSFPKSQLNWILLHCPAWSRKGGSLGSKGSSLKSSSLSTSLSCCIAESLTSSLQRVSLNRVVHSAKDLTANMKVLCLWLETSRQCIKGSFLATGFPPDTLAGIKKQLAWGQNLYCIPPLSRRACPVTPQCVLLGNLLPMQKCVPLAPLMCPRHQCKEISSCVRKKRWDLVALFTGTGFKRAFVGLSLGGVLLVVPAPSLNCIPTLARSWAATL
jgi:hypothetical protein